MMQEEINRILKNLDQAVNRHNSAVSDNPRHELHPPLSQADREHLSEEAKRTARNEIDDILKKNGVDEPKRNEKLAEIEKVIKYNTPSSFSDNLSQYPEAHISQEVAPNQNNQAQQQEVPQQPRPQSRFLTEINLAPPAIQENPAVVNPQPEIAHDDQINEQMQAPEQQQGQEQGQQQELSPRASRFLSNEFNSVAQKNQEAERSREDRMQEFRQNKDDIARE